VTSDGSPYARFRRALETGNELLVLGAARELPQIALEALPTRTAEAMEQLQALCVARGISSARGP
jgi:hypothetical protein